MRRILITLAVLASYPLIAAGSCATTAAAPEPVVRIVEVKIPVVTPCPDRRSAAPVYPDSDAAMRAAIAANDWVALGKMLLAARSLHYARHAEDDGQIAACTAPPPP